MNKCIEYDLASGKIWQHYFAEAPSNPPLGYGVLCVDASLDVGDIFVDVSTLKKVRQPTRPSTNHVFNYTTKQWEDPRTFADLKTAQWTQIKQTRSQAEYAGFVWKGSGFDSDAVSQNRITGAVTLAQMSSEFSIDWVLADNTTRTLNQTEMLQVGATLGQHIATQFSKGVALRKLIEAATTQAEVESVVW